MATGRSFRRVGTVSFTVVVAACLLAACGDDASEQEATPSDAPDGAVIYQESCASCHGTDLRGTDQGPSHLSQVYEPGHHSDDSFRAAVAQGSPAHHWEFGDMPPVAGLDDGEVDAVIAFIREQQEAEGFEPYPPE